ncbi:MAG TPA: DUF1653 domain-containing protein [Cytophagaceae bacterium]
MLIEERLEVKKGFYRHYKGNLYEVIDVVKHSETMEDLVLYKSLAEGVSKGKLWVRPVHMFLEDISYQGAEMPRFRYISELSVNN